MRRFVKISLLAAAVSAIACRELPDYLASDATIARVGRKELKYSDIAEAIPANLSGADIVSFVKLYVDKNVSYTHLRDHQTHRFIAYAV